MKGCRFITNGIHLAHKPDLGQQEITPCCAFKPEAFTSTGQQQYRHHMHQLQPLDQYLQQVNNDPGFTYERLRKTACTRCDHYESQFGYKRQVGRHTVYSSLRGRGDERIPSDLPAGKIAYLDVMFSNFCNHACTYCDSSFSSLWNDTARQLRPTHEKLMFMSSTNDYNTLDRERETLDLILDSDLSELRYIAVKGGEPFLARVFDEFMHELAQRCDLSRVEMILNTNNSIWPRQSIINTLSQLRHLYLQISGESTEALAEYIRYGTDWNKFVDNTKRWQEYQRQHNNMTIYFQSTVNILNINRLHEWLQWLEDMGIDSQDTNWPTQVWGSQDYRKLLTKRQAKILYKRYKHMEHPQWREFLLKNLDPKAYPDQQPELVPHYTKVMSQMEQHRGNSLQKVNPEMHDWLHT